MKRVLSILLIFALTANVVQFAIPLSWYLSNYHYISTELCINKLNPDIDCNGMCQLKKKMDQNRDPHEEHSHNSKNVVDRNSRVDLFVAEQTLIAPRQLFMSAFRLPDYQNFYSSWITEPTSPPPKLV